MWYVTRNGRDYAYVDTEEDAKRIAERLTAMSVSDTYGYRELSQPEAEQEQRAMDADERDMQQIWREWTEFDRDPPGS